MDSNLLVTILSALGGLGVGAAILMTKRHSARRTISRDFVHLPLRSSGAYKGVRLRHAAGGYVSLPFSSSSREKTKRPPRSKVR